MQRPRRVPGDQHRPAIVRDAENRQRRDRASAWDRSASLARQRHRRGMHDDRHAAVRLVPEARREQRRLRGDRHLDLVTKAEAVRRFHRLSVTSSTIRSSSSARASSSSTPSAQRFASRSPRHPSGNGPRRSAPASPVGEELGRHLRIVPGAGGAAWLEGTWGAAAHLARHVEATTRRTGSPQCWSAHARPTRSCRWRARAPRSQRTIPRWCHPQ